MVETSHPQDTFFGGNHEILGHTWILRDRYTFHLHRLDILSSLQGPPSCHSLISSWLGFMTRRPWWRRFSDDGRGSKWFTAMDFHRFNTYNTFIISINIESNLWFKLAIFERWLQLAHSCYLWVSCIWTESYRGRDFECQVLPNFGRKLLNVE